jgi:hypothetical protein
VTLQDFECATASRTVTLVTAPLSVSVEPFELTSDAL